MDKERETDRIMLLRETGDDDRPGSRGVRVPAGGEPAVSLTARYDSPTCAAKDRECHTPSSEWDTPRIRPEPEKDQ